MGDFINRPGFVWQFPGEVNRVIDGDSYVCDVLWRPGEQGDGVEVRADGINAVELKTKFGPEAKAAAEALLDKDPSTGSFDAGLQVTLLVTRREKYGRLLAKTVLPDGREFGSVMLTKLASDGTTPLAVAYNP